MKKYNYSVEHSIGSATGVIEANSKKDAREELTAQHSTTYTDIDGKKQTVKIKKIELSEVPL